MVSVQAFDLQLTVIYRSIDADFEDVKKALEQMMDNNLPQMIVGDFNFEPRSTNSLTTFLKKCGLCQIVECPTHKDGKILDHLYITESLKSTIEVDVQFKYFTDHAALQIKYKNDT